MGSKRRIADAILPIILKGRTKAQWYVEPFCGGCNTLERVEGKRLGNDVHPELIAMYKAVQRGWLPPDYVTEEEYNRLKAGKGEPHVRGYVGFSHAFGGKWFDTYARDKRGKGLYKNIEDRGRVSKTVILKQSELLKGVKFVNGAYHDLDIPAKSIVYCDPPYEGTAGYGSLKFNSRNFWQWCRRIAEEGHSIFISEYKAPEDFTCVWSGTINNNLNNVGTSSNERKTEKLFTYEV